MTAVYIIGGILLFILLLLLIPVGAEISYFDKLKIALRYGGVRVYDSGRQKKPPVHKKKKKKEEQGKRQDRKPEKQNYISRIFAEKGKIEGFKFCLDLIKLGLSKVIWVVRKIKFRKLDLSVCVSSDDAANTAVTYGAVCAAVYPVINIIDSNTSLTVKRVDIYTDFDKLSPEIRASVSLSTRLIYAVIAAASLFLGYLRMKKESDKNGRK